jgi:hypothetical protein
MPVQLCGVKIAKITADELALVRVKLRRNLDAASFAEVANCHLTDNFGVSK